MDEMSFIPSFKVGDVVSNNDLTKEFQVGNMGGMRRSKKTNSLILISDNTKGLYHDEWVDGVLNYTGMGKIGDQVLDGNQNRTLFDSDTNGVDVHLFEVDVPGQYKYSGRVVLAANPYQDNQPDDNGDMRKVWIFPLKHVSLEAATEQSGKPAAYNTVFHNLYGEGKVVKETGNNIYVDFNGKVLIFPIPESFEKGYLKKE